VTTRNQVYELNRKVLSERLKQSRDADEWRSSDDSVPSVRSRCGETLGDLSAF